MPIVPFAPDGAGQGDGRAGALGMSRGAADAAAAGVVGATSAAVAARAVVAAGGLAPGARGFAAGGAAGKADGPRPVQSFLTACNLKSLCGCEVEELSPMMSYVGAGNGVYVAETSYRYVGAGAGEFDVIGPEPLLRGSSTRVFGMGGGIALGVIFLIVVVVLIVERVSQATTTSTTTVRLRRPGLVHDCLFGEEKYWTTEKKLWCCRKEGRGCVKAPSKMVPFKCDVGIDDRATWPLAKKLFCCKSTFEHCGGLAPYDVAHDPQAFPPPAPAPTPPPASTCLIWGDPHIDGFDAPAHADFFFEGEVWLVKSNQIHIQARYRATPFTNGLAATETIAVGGPFMQGHVLKVGPLDTGSISWDNQVILTSFPSEHDASGLGRISYNDQGQLVDTAQNHLERHIVHVDLPNQVHIQIMRWSHHINLRITMPPADGGQDGHCGNYNGDGSDDSTDQILARIGNTVDQSELLFRTYLPTKGEQHRSVNDCPQDKREIARQQCLSARPDLQGQALDACLFDACFAGERYALQDTLY